MKTDPIVDEVRKAREAILAGFGFDLKKYAEHLRRKEAESGRTVDRTAPASTGQQDAASSDEPNTKSSAA